MRPAQKAVVIHSPKRSEAIKTETAALPTHLKAFFLMTLRTPHDAGSVFISSEHSVSSDDKLAVVLNRVRLDPALAYQGFRAPESFVQAVRLGHLGYRVMPTGIQTKIPCIKGWPELASYDPKALLTWLSICHYPNWSVLTGRANNLVILDWDGIKGREARAMLEAELGLLPPTWECDSGRTDGGRHNWFKLPPGDDEPRNQQGTKGYKLDVRGWHGHCVIAGSKHKSGTRYMWAPGCAPDEVELAEIPAAWWDWLPKKGDTAPARTRQRTAGRQTSATKADHDKSSVIIGDGPGEGGFNRPIRVLCCQFFSRYGTEANSSKFKEVLRNAILTADASAHTLDQVERYASDYYLDAELASAKAFISEAALNG